jgi:diguanylate cyclase (GGDEF)-like protein
LGVAQWWAAVPLAAVSFALAPIGRGLGFSSSLTTLLGYSTGIGLHLIVLIGTMRFASQSVAPRAERGAAGFWLAVTVGMLLLGDERGTRLLVHDVATVCVIVLVPVVLLTQMPRAELRIARSIAFFPLLLIVGFLLRADAAWRNPGIAIDLTYPVHAWIAAGTLLYVTAAIHGAGLLLHQRAQGATERLALEDALTGLLNRRAFDQRLASEIARANRSRVPFGLVLLDLDDLKQINDRHGHEAGDLVIETMASRLIRFLRETDLAARIGGDEFALILPGVLSSEKLDAAIRRLREMTTGPVTRDGIDLPVCSSIGGALWGEQDGDGGAMIRLADERMYADKARTMLRR